MSALGGAHGLHAILDVVLDDQKTSHASVVKDYQQDPIRGYLTHIDLHEVRLDQPISAPVPSSSWASRPVSRAAAS